MGQKDSYVAVIADVDVSFQADDGRYQYTNVIFVYQPADVAKYSKNPVFTTWNFFEVAALIFLAMMLIVLLYTLWHEGLKKLIGYQAGTGDELVE